MKKHLRIGLICAIGCVSLATIAVHASNVMIDTTNKKIIIQSGNQIFDIDHLPSQGGLQTSTSEIGLSTASSSTQTPVNNKPSPILTGKLTAELAGGTEMDKALYWMYQNGLTQYDTLQGYRPDDTLLREEAAKIIGQAYIVLGYDQTTKYTQCTFSDQNIFNHSLAPFIQKTCSYGIFKGAYGKFLPHNSLTKAETLAVLIRIFEGKMSDESLNPRWTIPFVKAKHIALTNETEVSGLDRPITRREVALLIYRFKKLVLSEQFRQIAKNQLELINQDPKKYIPPQTLLANKDKDGKGNGKDGKNGNGGGNGTGNNSNNNNSQNGSGSHGSGGVNQSLINDILSNPNNAISISILNTPEVHEALQRMRDSKMTDAKDIPSYQPFNFLIRSHAAKMFVHFAKLQHASGISGTNSSCVFTDINKLDTDLQNHIQTACQLGIMQGEKGKFNPERILTKAEFIAMLIRLSEGKHLNEQESPRWGNYFLKAKEAGILNNDDIPSFESALTRYEAGLLFYRFQLKQKIASHLNTDNFKNELVSTRKTVNGEFAQGDNERSYAVTFDINLLKNQFFNAGFVEVLGTRYELKKTSMTVFDIGDESFVRYGDLLDIRTSKKIGTANFVISNGNLIQGTLRLIEQDVTWLIKESISTTAWFNLIRG